MTEEPILKRGKRLAKLDVMKKMAEVERDHGVGRYRQVWEILNLRFGPRKSPTHEYYLEGFYRTDLTPEQKSKLHTQRTIQNLNTALSPPDLGSMSALLANKVLTGAYLKGFGFPAPETHAVYGGDTAYPGIPHLTTQEDLEDFLRNAPFPIFGKAVASSLGVGGAIILKCEGDTLHLGNGREVPVSALAAEIVEYLGDGYVFQSFERQRKEAEAIAGLAVGIVRVVTLLTAKGPELYYTLWRLPAKGAMADGALGDGIQGGRTNVLFIDHTTGRTVAPPYVTPASDTSEVTGAKLYDVEVPDLDAMIKLCRDIHLAFPGHGVLGFDVIQGERGPVICEINSNPHHSLVQKALGGPMEDPERQALLDAALAHVETRRGAMAKGARNERARKRKGQLAEVGFRRVP